MLLFCIASSTPHARVGITSDTVQHMVIRGLVEPDQAGGLGLTEEGRAVLVALIRL
jgi:hypothetical protein